MDCGPALDAPSVVLLVIEGLLPVATVYHRTLVDSIVAAIRWRCYASIRRALTAAVAMATVLLLGEILRGVTNWLRAVQAELVQDHISGLIHQKSMRWISRFTNPLSSMTTCTGPAEASHRPIGNPIPTGSYMLAQTGYIVWLLAGRCSVPVAVTISGTGGFLALSGYAAIALLVQGHADSALSAWYLPSCLSCFSGGH